MSAPIFAGSDRALVRVESGEYIAVDTNSIDSIPYLVGHPIEEHAVFVFRCFLRPDSVVLDIGANFGLSPRSRRQPCAIAAASMLSKATRTLSIY